MFFKNIYIEMFLLETIKIMVYATTVTSELVNLFNFELLRRKNVNTSSSLKDSAKTRGR